MDKIKCERCDREINRDDEIKVYRPVGFVHYVLCWECADRLDDIIFDYIDGKNISRAY